MDASNNKPPSQSSQLFCIKLRFFTAFVPQKFTRTTTDVTPGRLPPKAGYPQQIRVSSAKNTLAVQNTARKKIEKYLPAPQAAKKLLTGTIFCRIIVLVLGRGNQLGGIRRCGYNFWDIPRLLALKVDCPARIIGGGGEEVAGYEVQGINWGDAGDFFGAAGCGEGHR